MNREIPCGKVRTIVPTALLLLALVSSSAQAEPMISTKFISIVERAGAVLVVGNGLQTCVPLRYKRSVPGPNLKLNTPDNYQFYAMSTANCQPGTAMAGFYTTLGFQGENSATITIGLSNSGFSYR
ncbi:TPA: hypothetical protein HH295_11675 [Xanthomonas vasicola pv. zeae]|uniref:hypothetical protein n=1 Tax=Xanthomonas vasicola TaxID=56459 RepID=UPI000B6F4580|nr:hypothetical protein [Xanthomonas vasicola]MDO6956197.1 hypothetical protein [Xanthomonas vasicola]MDO6973068.1 hypothetical protein [Xanthomonas vasicola]OWF60974.1 hypothetical protein B1H32_10745 [Xanthomonas vasicola pv. vasculorum]OWF60989.1 hypothetical protein B1H41_11290 [Xanthomonas vasicola pv. vasculorum]HHZ24600.1 hypothetical protein [Xanthomonas vasicola pv. zeae]